MKTRMLVFIIPFISVVLLISSCVTTIFKRAAESGNYNGISKLIERGADVNDQNRRGYTALMIASESGYTEIAKLLIDEGAAVNVKAKGGITALMIASEEGHTDFVELLIEAGAFTNDQDYYGESVLLKAARHGRIEIVELLLEAGADVHAVTRSVAWGTTTLSGGIREGETRGGYTALMAASEMGYIDIVKLLIESGADVNARTTRGEVFKSGGGITSLMFAAKGGHIEVVKLLIEEGADVNARDDYGFAAWDWAIYGFNEGVDIEIAMKIENILRREAGIY